MPLFSKVKFPERPAGPDEVVLGVRDVQVIGLELLDAFDAFCRRHGLRYYLCGGTLLGAVRHGGFIPWDDDVDVIMARPDYDRLVKLCEAGEIAPDTQFACLENGRFPRPFARVYDLKTQVQRKYHKPVSGAHVWIDILPIDGLPKEEKKLKRLYGVRFYINKYNFWAMWKPGTGNRKRIVLRHWRYCWFAMPIGAMRWARLLDRMGRSRPYETFDTVGCFTAGRYGPGEAMPKEAFEIPVKVSFEGRELETMSCWKEYLTGIYGDYMSLPPEDKRVPHLDYVTMRRADYDALRRRHPELTEK